MRAFGVDIETQLANKYADILVHLDEKQKRIVLAGDAVLLGRGGVSIVSRASKISRPTIHKGIKELSEDPNLATLDRTRSVGGGRKKIIEQNPKLINAVKKIIDPSTRGDPESPLKWTCKSIRNITEEINSQGFIVEKNTIRNILHDELKYSLQANSKTLEGKNHPDRDKQFKYINKQVKKFMRANSPVISIDAKKKEKIGEYDNKGKQWHPKGSPQKVKSHDFPDKNKGKVTPYGVYDINNDFGLVNVGCDYDTSAFAVESIRRWWKQFGIKVYPEATKLLICADAGGSNGYKRRLWKTELQKFAINYNLEITVLHFPPGTSKWNKIEHRLFSHISMNWKGEPLTSHEVVLKFISNTTTKTGLKVHAKMDNKKYPKGIKISDAKMKEIKLKKHAFHGEWNYTIRPI